MNIFDYINHLNYNVVRKKLFRREVESAFYSKKKIKLPASNKIQNSELEPARENYPFAFFSNQQEKNKLIDDLISLDESALIIKKADDILMNNYRFPGKGSIFLGDAVCWNKDYSSRFEWGQSLSWKENFFETPEGVDIKNAWYLARFHQGIVLGEAYLLTGDEKYSLYFLHLFTNFIERNNFCTGINWIKTSEVSIRLLNILFSFGFFISSDAIDESIYNALIDFILHHSFFIENNLEYTGIRGSSYLVNILALGAAGIFLKESYYGKKNMQFAYVRLEQEIRQQLHDDGVSYEQSVPLHSILLEIFFLAKILFSKEGYKFTDLYDEKLKLMFDVQAAYILDDNSVPQIGDAIISRIIPLNQSFNQPDFVSIMAAGTVLFNEPRFKSFNKHATLEVALMFGSDAFEEYKNIKTEVNNSSEGFIGGGHFILRDKNLNLFIEAGEIGKRGLGAPGHNDTFTFELFYKNEKIIVDPGTYSIYADKEIRNKLRSVKNHNTSYVDDKELSELDGLFKIKDDITKPKIIDWRTDNDEDFLSVQHYGYARLTDPVIIKRSFHFIKDKKIIEIKDEFFGGDSHKVVSNITFHPDIFLSKIGDNSYSAGGKNSELKIKISSSLENLVCSINNAPFSEEYGNIRETKKITTVFNEKLPAFIITEIKLY